MNFEKGHIYHIYNQGNNQQYIFFKRENYLFLLEKIKSYITPYADILAWCLMPNHFHLMVLVREVSIIHPLTQSTHPMTASHRMSKPRTLNNSIAIMLRSYTRAIQKQEKISGSLFKQKTKAECITCIDNITPSFYYVSGATRINIQHPEVQYPQICFNYIHQNPVKAKLAAKETDWEFSSALDYAGFRNGTLINKEIAKQYVTYSSDDLESSDE